MPLEPLPETDEVLRRLSPWSDGDLVAELREQGRLVEEVVPSLVGLSLALLREGLTFTLAATSESPALLDAVQYVMGGPCVDAAVEDRTVHTGDDTESPLDEQRWAEFARARAAHGVLSTLSLPIHEQDRVVGSVNLYSSAPHGFAGTAEAVAEIVGAWAPGAVLNADLSFSTRTVAEQAPRVLEDLTTVDAATGVVMAAVDVGEAVARQLIADSAWRSGQSEPAVARALLRAHTVDRDDAQR